MPGLIKSLFTTPQRSGRRLHSDAVAIIQSDQRSGSAEFLQRIADLARDELASFESQLNGNQKNREVLVYDLQQKHKNARHRRDNALFTATTLVLIYLRAKDLGEHGQAATLIVDNFIVSPLPPGKDDDSSDV